MDDNMRTQEEIDFITTATVSLKEIAQQLKIANLLKAYEMKKVYDDDDDEIDDIIDNTH